MNLPVAVVIGGANVDVKARSKGRAVLATSNPGLTHSSAGGVGRNIAENLARLGTETRLLAAVGTDAFGERLLRETGAAGVLVDNVLRSETPTGTYTAVLDNKGELVIAVSDMVVVDELDPEFICSSTQVVTSADFLVLDGNLRFDVVETALTIAQSASVPVLIDPVSDAKAELLASALHRGRPVFAITPNRSELAALTSLPTQTDEQMRAAASVLHGRGVGNVWVSRGHRGSLLFSAGAEVPVVFDVAQAAKPVADVTGAGDAMVGAFVHAILAGDDLEAAITYAHVAAALTVESSATVRADLTSALVQTRLAIQPKPTGTP